MTVRIVEQDGKFYAYHAHIVYHGDPDSVDFNPEDNSVVEVMAELPHSSHLSSMRSADQAGRELKPRDAMIDVICPDPQCGSVTTYPITGNAEAKAVHERYAQDITDEHQERRLKMDVSNPEDIAPLHSSITTYVANAWARKEMGLDPVGGHDHLHAMHEPNGELTRPSK